MVQKLLDLELNLLFEHLLERECVSVELKTSHLFLQIVRGEREVDEEDVCRLSYLLTTTAPTGIVSLVVGLYGVECNHIAKREISLNYIPRTRILFIKHYSIYKSLFFPLEL